MTGAELLVETLRTAPRRLEPARPADAADRRVLDLPGEAKRPLILLGPAMARPQHQLQLQHYGDARAAACELLPSRYDLVVEALGGHGEYVERPEDFEGALASAGAH